MGVLDININDISKETEKAIDEFIRKINPCIEEFAHNLSVIASYINNPLYDRSYGCTKRHIIATRYLIQYTEKTKHIGQESYHAYMNIVDDGSTNFEYEIRIKCWEHWSNIVQQEINNYGCELALDNIRKFEMFYKSSQYKMLNDDDWCGVCWQNEGVNRLHERSVICFDTSKNNTNNKII